jgi:hypothetical protein
MAQREGAAVQERFGTVVNGLAGVGRNGPSAHADAFSGTDQEKVRRRPLQRHDKAGGSPAALADHASRIVVAMDGTSSDSDHIQHHSLFQLLNAPSLPNAANAPLAMRAVTLSDTNLITFGR